VERAAKQLKKIDYLGRWGEAGLALILLAIFALLYSQTIADPDLWGHLRFGRDIWESGRVSKQDPYSYLTVGQKWINHEWLAEVLFWRTFALAGTKGLVLLKLAMGLLTTTLLYIHLRRRVGALGAAFLLLLLTPLPLWRLLVTMRPQLLTLLCFTLVLLILQRAEEGGLRNLWLLPPLFAAWANCHGGFLAGLGVLILWAGVRVVLGIAWRSEVAFRLSEVLALTGPVAASAGATLLNPYGPGLWAFLLRTATVAREEITEWQPLALLSSAGLSYLIPLGITAVGLLYSQRERRPALVAIYACAAMLPLFAARHLALFAVSATVLAGEHVYDLWCRQFPREGTARRAFTPWRFLPWFVPLSVYVVGVLVPLTLLRSSEIRSPVSCIQLPAAYYPVRAVALLRAAAAAGNLATDFDWGEYVLWHLGPQVKVSVDGRRETVYSDEVYRQNLRFVRGEGDWDALLTTYPTDMALVRADGPADNLLRLKPGWSLAYEDEASALFVREDSPLRERLQAASLPEIPYDGRGLCFP